jgi:hypothetical protein
MQGDTKGCILNRMSLLPGDRQSNESGEIGDSFFHFPPEPKTEQ